MLGIIQLICCNITDILDTFDLIPKTLDQRAQINWNVNCSTAINQLLTDATNMGTLFYALLNGLYLGQWGDYESCLVDATQGQYLLVTIKGDYIGPAQFTRGGAGKFDQFATYVGIKTKSYWMGACISTHPNNHSIFTFKFYFFRQTINDGLLVRQNFDLVNEKI